MKPNDTEIWFYIKDRQQKGPIGSFELTKLFEQGVLNSDTYLWTEGATDWEKAKTVEDFKYCCTTISPLGLQMSDTGPKNKPMLRIIAKVFDIALLTVLLSTFISIFSMDLILKTSKLTLFFIYLFLWFLFEPVMLTIFGTTIGKSLLNIKVKCVNGELLDYLTAFKRNLYIFSPGKGLGYPLIMLTSNSFPLFALRKNTRSLWDEETGTIILYGTSSLPKLLISSCFPLLVFILGILMSVYN
jgi:uncharacterized RDD family membrane protein YckC